MKERYLVNGSSAVELYTEEIKTVDQLLSDFSKMITSPNLKDAFVLSDQNENGQSREGMTVYGVVSDESLSVYIHENNYEVCKDLMGALKQMVDRALERLNKSTQIEIVNEENVMTKN